MIATERVDDAKARLRTIASDLTAAEAEVQRLRDERDELIWQVYSGSLLPKRRIAHEVGVSEGLVRQIILLRDAMHSHDDPYPEEA